MKHSLFYGLWKSIELFFKTLIGLNWLFMAASFVILVFQLIGWYQYNIWSLYTLENITGILPYLPYEYHFMQPVIHGLFKLPVGWITLLAGFTTWLLLMFGYSWSHDKAMNALPNNRKKHLIHHNLAAG